MTAPHRGVGEEGGPCPAVLASPGTVPSRSDSQSWMSPRLGSHVEPRPRPRQNPSHALLQGQMEGHSTSCTRGCQQDSRAADRFDLLVPTLPGQQGQRTAEPPPPQFGERQGERPTSSWQGALPRDCPPAHSRKVPGHRLPTLDFCSPSALTPVVASPALSRRAATKSKVSG